MLFLHGPFVGYLTVHFAVLINRQCYLWRQERKTNLMNLICKIVHSLIKGLERNICYRSSRLCEYTYYFFNSVEEAYNWSVSLSYQDCYSSMWQKPLILWLSLYKIFSVSIVSDKLKLLTFQLEISSLRRTRCQLSSITQVIVLLNWTSSHICFIMKSGTGFIYTCAAYNAVFSERLCSQ